MRGMKQNRHLGGKAEAGALPGYLSSGQTGSEESTVRRLYLRLDGVK